jgi:hypothetical protein
MNIKIKSSIGVLIVLVIASTILVFLKISEGSIGYACLWGIVAIASIIRIILLIKRNKLKS